jgi:hypothetical protein
VSRNAVSVAETKSKLDGANVISVGDSASVSIKVNLCSAGRVMATPAGAVGAMTTTVATAVKTAKFSVVAVCEFEDGSNRHPALLSWMDGVKCDEQVGDSPSTLWGVHQYR